MRCSSRTPRQAHSGVHARMVFMRIDYGSVGCAHLLPGRPGGIPLKRGVDEHPGQRRPDEGRHKRRQEDGRLKERPSYRGKRRSWSKFAMTHGMCAKTPCLQLYRRTNMLTRGSMRCDE